MFFVVFRFFVKERLKALKQWLKRTLAVLLLTALLCPAELPALAQTLSGGESPSQAAEPFDGTVPATVVQQPTETPEPETEQTPEPDTAHTAAPEETPEPELFRAADETIGVKQQVKLRLENIPEGAALTFATSDKKICTVDKNGKVTGVAKGGAVITITAATGETAHCRVTVAAVPSKVTISNKSLTLIAGEEADLSCALPSGTAAAVTWSSSKSSVATVDADGHVKALKAGTATITVKTHNGKKASCKLTVRKATGWISAAEEELLLGEGQKVEDLFSIEKNTYATVTYGCEVLQGSADGGDVVRMEGDVLVAAAAGEAIVSAQTHNGHRAEVKVRVVPAPQDFALSCTGLEVGVKQKGRIAANLPEGTAAEVTYFTGNKKIATVSADGEVQGLKVGTTEITVRTHNGVEKTCTVYVRSAPSKVTLQKTETVLYTGMAEDLSYFLPVNTMASVTWSGSSSVMEVSPQGTVTALAAGTGTVTIKTHNGKKDTLKVYVYDVPQQLQLQNATMEMGVKQKITLKPDTDAPHYRALQFESSDPEIVKISTSGAMEALKAGSATITIRTLDGERSAQTEVTVYEAPAKVSLQATSVTLGVGAVYQIEPQVAEGCYAGCTYSVNNKNVTVTADGLVTAQKTGSSKITVRTYNGKSVVLNVTVKKAPEWIRPAAEEIVLGVGQQAGELFTIDSKAGTALTYAFAPEGVVEFRDGRLTAVAEGDAVVTATTHNELSAQVKIRVLPAPQEMTISAETLEMGVKQKEKLTATLPEGTAAGLTFTSSAPSVVKVDAEGNLQALKTGSAVITVRTHNDVIRECSVTVRKAPGSISIAGTEPVLYVGIPMKLAYTLPKDTSAAVKWSVSNSKLLTVNEDGSITAKEPGTAQVTVTAHNGVKSTKKVYIYNAPTHMELKQASPLEMGVGQKLEIRPDTDAVHYRQLSFTSSDPAVAPIERNGMLQAKKTGKAVITVKTLDDSIVRTLEVHVYAAPAKVKLPESSIQLGIGDTYEITPDIGESCRTAFTYESNNKGASVTADGIVTAKVVGTTKILIKTHNGKSAVLTVKVTKQPEKILLDQTTLAMETGETAQLKYKLTEGSYSEVTWSSSDISVCDVDQSGNVTAKAKGNAVITARTTNGLTAECAVKVVLPAVSIDAPATVSVEVGQFKKIEVTALTADGKAYEGTIRVVSGNTDYVKVTDDGRIYGKQKGQCKVRVYAGEKYADVDVLVLSDSNDSRRDIIVSACLEKLGCKYVYAHKGPNEFDCAGLVYYGYIQVGIKLRYSAQSQGYSEGFQITKDELLPGDIVCFNTNETDGDLSDHTGIYIGNGKFVHASSAKGEVMISDLTTGYYSRVFSWGRRRLD